MVRLEYNLQIFMGLKLKLLKNLLQKSEREAFENDLNVRLIISYAALDSILTSLYPL